MKNDLYRRKYTEPPKLDEAGLTAYLKTQPDVAAAYLFGSLATGKATVDSDVDIAILLADVPDDAMRSLDRETRLSEDIRPFVNREFDLVILNKASLTLCQEVFATGRLLYEGDPPVRVEFQVKVAREYADMKPVYDFFTRALLEAAREGRLGKPGSVIFPGWVSDEDLPAVYAGAAAVAFPSDFEGFGLPVLEGMACGAPVLCSNTSSLPEIAGDAALLVDPTDTDAITAGLHPILCEPDVVAELRRRGYEQAARFSWGRAAAETAQVYERVGAKS